MENRIAVIGIIVENEEMTSKLNEILHEYGKHIIGRLDGVSATTAYSKV